MSNFSKEDLVTIYGQFVESFKALAIKAKKYEIVLEVEVATDGSIQFSSRDYFTDEEGEKVTSHVLIRSDKVEAEESRTVLLRERAK